MSNYAENICIAIDQIVTAKLEGLAYDITKLCTIVNDSDKNNGRYTVNDGSIKFDAYSSDKNLRVGNSVLVTIPNGDYNMQKTIVGKQTATNTQPFIYTAPLDTMIAIENIAQLGEPGSLLANDKEIMTKKVLELEGIENFVGFTRLGISADFQAWLAGYDTMAGSYGLKLLIYTNETNLVGNSPKEAIYELTLSNLDMYGNPYNFETFFTQEKVFDISYINDINRIEGYFFHSADFLDGQKNPIPHLVTTIEGLSPEKLPDNLFIDNIKLYMGYDQNAFTEDTIILYTKDSMTYDNKLDPTSLEAKIANKKTISARWIHKKEDGKFELITQDQLGENFNLRWYRFNRGSASPDSYAGVNWVMGEQDNLIYSFDPDITKATEEIKAIGIVKETTGYLAYRSELIIFTNESEVPNEESVNKISDLTIYFEDESDGNYFIYNQNGKLIDASQGSGKKRYMRVLYKGSELKEGMGVQEITWYLPVRNSMIRTDQAYYEDADEVDIAVEYKYTAYDIISRKPRGDEKPEPRQAYYIGDQWSPTYANNIVECHVKINNQVYTTIENVMFGKSGTNGADHTFVLNFDNGRNCLSLEDLNKDIDKRIYLMTLGQDKNDKSDDQYVVFKKGNDFLPAAFKNTAGLETEIQVSAHLYDAAGKEIPLTSDMTISWSWMHEGADSKYLAFKNIQHDGSEESKQEAFNKKIITLKETAFPGDDKKNISDNYNILQATLSGWGGSYNLITYLPIPIRTKNKFRYISGAKEVIYNHQGVPSYYKGVYNLYEDDPGLPDYEKNRAKCGWEISCPEEDYAPILKETENGVGLSANVFYLKGQSDKVCVYCYDLDTKEILWSQPILIMQNQYDFSMLNEWDGSLTINEENGTILSTMLGAGRKNNDNTFSGVLIGDIKKGTDSEESNTATGVYGLYEGKISYALKEDGTATFGTTGRGQIHIDGNESTIYSSEYENGAGMMIDLDDGILDIKDYCFYYDKIDPNKVDKNNFKYYYIYKLDEKIYVTPDVYDKEEEYYDKKIGKPQIKIQPKDPYFEVKSLKGNPLIHVGSKDYYLQNDDYTTATGMKISLKDGSIKTSKHGSGSILISPNDPFLQVSDGVNNLMYMGTNNYYLQSSNYSGTTQQYCMYNETKYLIYSDKNNKLYAVNGMNIYSISGGEVDNKTGQMTGMSLTAYNPSYNKETITGGSNNSLPSTSEEEITGDEAKKIFLTEIIPVLTQIKPKGLYVDLNNGIILGYDLYLKGTSSTNSDSKFFILDSGAPEYPFQVSNKFKLNWDGTLTCYKINELSNTGDPTGYAININDNFYIDQNGNGSGSGFHAGTAGYAGSAGSATKADTATTADFAYVAAALQGGLTGEDITSSIEGLRNYCVNNLQGQIDGLKDSIAGLNYRITQLGG